MSESLYFFPFFLFVSCYIFKWWNIFTQHIHCDGKKTCNESFVTEYCSFILDRRRIFHGTFTIFMSGTFLHQSEMPFRVTWHKRPSHVTVSTNQGQDNHRTTFFTLPPSPSETNLFLPLKKQELKYFHYKILMGCQTEFSNVFTWLHHQRAEKTLKGQLSKAKRGYGDI